MESGYREIKNPNEDFDIFEKSGAQPVKPITSPFQRFSLPFNLASSLMFGVGILVMIFGATTAGSFYSATSRFKGVLASMFYEWQVGTIILVVGMLLIYSAIRKR